MSIISLLSDFGQKDPYVAEMKGVILSISPQTCIVDVSHEIKKFNIRMGAYALASASPFFPANTIHVAVVDPGVGTNRRPIIVETPRNLYVGPDNGLLMLAAQHETITKVYAIDNPKYMLANVSKTFHGRDIFAPTAAHLARGIRPSTFGSTIQDYSFPDFAEPHVDDDKLVGEVLHVDDFGNIISNISTNDLESYVIRDGDSLVIELGAKTFNLPFFSAYGKVSVGSPLLLIGGNNFLEVAVNQGNASKIFGAKIGDVFRICLRDSS